MREVILDLDDTQQRLVKPDRFTKADHVWVQNASDATVFLNFWDDLAVTGSPALAIADVDDQCAVPAGFAGIVLLELGVSGSLVLSASTGSDGTGAPSDALSISVRWG